MQRRLAAQERVTFRVHRRIQIFLKLVGARRHGISYMKFLIV
jgi:hypothetical protein